MNVTKSEALFERAQAVIPGGVNSPVRAFRSVGGTPRFIASAKGSRVKDVDGNEYIDYVGSWGPMILGHADERVVTAAREALRKGSSFGAPTELEVEMAELVVACFPSIELVRMVNSGTEAVMSAVRLARASTGRDRIIKFDGCWHGHADGLLVKAGSTGLQYGVPDSAGVPAAYAQHTLVARYNDLDSVRALLAENEGEVAAILVEPVAGNMGVVPPASGFLEGLRALADDSGALLILDEVITGFRLALGGAQEHYGVRADLTTLGKIIGGGFPVGAYGGKREIMQQVSPLGPAVQAGTLSGNPVAMSAGLATLRALREPGVYESLEAKSRLLADGLAQAARRAGVAVTCNRVGSMMTAFFTDRPVTNADDLSHCSREAYARFFHGMLERGVAFAPSYCEAAFVSAAHAEADIDRTIRAAGEALAAVAEGER
jgi:glutamate-1-semialdehyde 2,1-aminomutase